MSGLVVGVPLIGQRLTVSTVTNSLVRDVVHVLREKLDRAITENELGTTLVLRLETLGRHPVGKVRATKGIQRSTRVIPGEPGITNPDDRVVDRTGCGGPV